MLKLIIVLVVSAGLSACSKPGANAPNTNPQDPTPSPSSVVEPSPVACEANQTAVAGACVATNQSQSCAVTNGTGTQSSTNGGVSFDSCALVSCNSGFTDIAGVCVTSTNTQSCAITNGTGSQGSADGGQTWGTCTVQSCDSNYTQVANVCVLTNQSHVCTDQPANSTGGLNISSNGGVSFGACSGFTCDGSYTNVSGTCALTNQNRACTITNGTGSQSTTDGGQTWGTCSAQSCNVGYGDPSNNPILNSCTLRSVVITAASGAVLEVAKIVTSPVFSASNTALAAITTGKLASVGVGSPSTGAILLPSYAIASTGSAPAPVVNITASASSIDFTLLSNNFETTACTLENQLSAFLLNSCTEATGFLIPRAEFNSVVPSSDPIDINVSIVSNGITSNSLTVRRHIIRRITNLTMDTASPNTGKIASVNNTLFASIKNGGGSTRLFKFDGTTLSEASANNPGMMHHDGVAQLTSFKNALYYVSSLLTNNNRYLFKYDGVDNLQISNTYGFGSDETTNLLNVGDSLLYFSSRDTSGKLKLFTYNGTTITQISDIYTGGDDSPETLTWYNGNLYFTAVDSLDGRRLYKYDGSSITQLERINGDAPGQARILGVYAGKLYFRELNGSEFTKIFRYDGSTIEQFSDINNGGEDYNSSTSEFAVVGSNMYFGAQTATGRKLFKYNGTVITQISNISTGDDAVANLTEFAGKLFFVAQNSSGYTKIYKYDGTSIVQVSDIWQGSTDTPANLTVATVAGSTDLYFSAIRSGGIWNLYKYSE